MNINNYIYQPFSIKIRLAINHEIAFKIYKLLVTNIIIINAELYKTKN